MPGLSNWREEFNLSEVVTGKMTDKEALRKVSEKKGIKNKVIINPKLDEAVNEIGGEVISMVEQDTDAQKQRLDRKQMILDRQKLKLRRKDMSQAKQEKKQGMESDPTGALKQGNVIAFSGFFSVFFFDITLFTIFITPSPISTSSFFGLQSGTILPPFIFIPTFL